MGRPLNKRLFAAAGVGPTAGGSEIKVNFHNGTAVKEGYIVKQKGSKKFVCEEIETPGEFTCTLTTGVLPANLTAGQMAISFNMDDSETYGVSKITGRKATLIAHSATGTNLYEGNSVPWNFATSTSDGAAQVEEAGDDNTLTGTDDDDFTEDA
jgi:hypothetical protein